MWRLQSFLRGSAWDILQLRLETRARYPSDRSSELSNYSFGFYNLLRTYDRTKLPRHQSDYTTCRQEPTDNTCALKTTLKRKDFRCGKFFTPGRVISIFLEVIHPHLRNIMRSHCLEHYNFDAHDMERHDHSSVTLRSQKHPIPNLAPRSHSQAIHTVDRGAPSYHHKSYGNHRLGSIQLVHDPR